MTALIGRYEIESWLADAIAELGPERDAIRPEATFEELNLNSRDFYELSQIVEAHWGVRLELEDVHGLRTVGDVYELVFANIVDRVLDFA